MTSGHFHEELTPAIKAEAAVKDLIPTTGSEKNTAINRLTFFWRTLHKEKALEGTYRQALCENCCDMDGISDI